MATVGATSKRSLLEEDEEFYEDFDEEQMIRDAEEEAMREQDQMEMEALAAAGPPTSSPYRAPSGAQKSSTMLVEEEAFASGHESGDEAEAGFIAPSHAPVISKRPANIYTGNKDYTTTYSDLTTLNLNLRPAMPEYIEATPIAATLFSGKRITFRRRMRIEGLEDTASEAKKNSREMLKLSSEMLDFPYQTMLRSIEADQKLLDKVALADAAGADLMDTSSAPETALWTDRYRPKKFTDLLGDERVHRSALLWLKEWDQCVFKGANMNTAAAEAKRERRKKRAREAKLEYSSFGADGEEERAPDAHGRPQEKLLLLCGPPGLGKTTLAYVLARQAGYQVLEVNASDDRTSKVVTEKIRNGLESSSLSMGGSKKGGGMGGGTNSKGRPTCIIIDEIDGAGGGGDTSFVKTLVKLVLEGSSTRKYKGKGKKDRPLLRPIICICNDLYAPTLRTLRPLARIIRFTPPTNLMLVKRLKMICDEESLGADSKCLTMLAEIAEGDLRSCLNTLQFIKRRSTVVDEHAIKSTMVGMKDTATSVSAVWDRLFKKPARRKGGGGDDDKYVNRIVRDVQTCGEYEKISQGCFENYLLAPSSNDAWTRINEANDWLFLYDRLDSRLRTDRDYELLAYVPYTFVPWYKLFSSHKSGAIEFPKADYEAYLKRTAHQEVADAFVTGMPHTLRGIFTGKNVVIELLPYMNRIICPDLKPINSQLIKTEERLVMLKLVNSLLTLKLSFIQDKNEEGQLSYKLEPPIDVFVHFDGKRASDIAPSRYAVRHMISREMEAEGIRRTDGDGEATTAKDIIAAYNTKTPQVKEDVKLAVDFFGRAITIIVPAVDDLAAAPPRKKQRAVYKYHEGFSNAVRVTKRMADFL